MSYKVCTETSVPQYKFKQMEVIRRFRDFAWLHSRLQEQNRGAHALCAAAGSDKCWTVFLEH